ncbi:MAG: tape measure protein [Gammaproteobacteria bacterium]|nr:tape measure protein [Gammaproteobacteria bacterium]
MSGDLVVGIRLKADSSGFAGEVRVGQRELDKLGGGARKAAQASEGLATALRRVGQVAGALVGVAAIKSLATGLFQAGVAAQRLDTTFRFVAGSVGGAAQEMAFVRETAGQLGLDLYSAADAYAALAAAAKGTSLEGQGARDTFRAVAGAATALGLSAETTQGALLAVQQMISKGTVAAEELRGQLGERLPGAFQIAARAMGVSTSKLGEMLQAGEVVADEFLPRFARELERTFGGVLGDASHTAQAELNRLKTAWTELQVSFAEGGGLAAATDGIRALADALRAVGPHLGEVTLGAAALIAVFASAKAARALQAVAALGGVTLAASAPAAVPVSAGIIAGTSIAAIGASVKSYFADYQDPQDRIRELRKEYGYLDAYGRERWGQELLDEIEQLNEVLRQSREVVFSGRQRGNSVPGEANLANLPRQGTGSRTIDQISWETNQDKTAAARATAAAKAEEEQARIEQRFAELRQTTAQILSEGERDMAKLLAEQARTEAERVRQRKEGFVDAARALGQSLLTEREQILAAHEQRLMDLETFERKGLDIGMSYAEARQRIIDQTAAELAAANGESLQALTQTGVDAFAQLKQAVEGWGRDAAAAIVDFTFTGKTSFSDMVSSILKDLARMAVYESVTKPLFAALSGALGGALFGAAPVQTGPSPAPIPGLNPAGRALGGPADAGRAYLVGEAGPELLLMGRRSGHVLPRVGGGDVHVTVNVNAQTGASDVAADASRLRALGSGIAAAVRSVLADEQRPGGLLASR